MRQRGRHRRSRGPLLIQFFDASAFVKRYIQEDESARIRQLLARDLPAISRISEVEVASALSRRCREGYFSPAERDRAITVLREDVRSLLIVEVTGEVVSTALGLLARHSLRASDAIQLASGLELRQRLQYPVSFVAFDQKLREAAHAEDLKLAELSASTS